MEGAFEEEFYSAQSYRGGCPRQTLLILQIQEVRP
jgi:hypothetical protein